MQQSTPPQGVSYVGQITDTSRWENFKPRPDDIFVCTPPKCGTTWTQAICAMLVFGTPDHGQRPGNISPWVDAKFVPIEEYLNQIDQQEHRRFLKTHSPFDGIPYDENCTYLVIFRDPRDAYFSGLNHRDNMVDQELALNTFTSGGNAFDDWLYNEREPGEWDVVSIQQITQTLDTYWAYRDLPNVHMFHYSDMKRDLKGVISAMAKALDIEVDDDMLDVYTKAATFDAMKSKASTYAPVSGVGFWKSESGFFATGANKQWKDKLSAEQLAAFDARLEQLMPDKEKADWLLNGSG